jgi:hypothetical protein
MNGQCHSAQPITEPYTVLVTNDSGAQRRDSTRLPMRFDSGGTRGTEVRGTQTSLQQREATSSLTDRKDRKKELNG